MTATITEFEALLSSSESRLEAGLEMTDAEADRVLKDPVLLNAYFDNWSRNSSERNADVPGAESHEPRPEAGRRPTDRMRIAIVFGAIGALILALIGVWLATRPPAETALETAATECVIAGAIVGDEGKSLELDMRAEGESSGIDVEEIHCVLHDIDVPDSVIAQIWQTTALQGRQNAGWDGYSATWTYHPDEGLNLILVQES